MDELKEREQRVAQLELSVLARDETIAGLEQRLRASDRSEAELLATSADLEGRAAALELEMSLVVESGAQKERDCRNAEQKVMRLEGLLREAGREIDDLVTVIERRGGRSTYPPLRRRILPPEHLWVNKSYSKEPAFRAELSGLARVRVGDSHARQQAQADDCNDRHVRNLRPFLARTLDAR